MKVQVEVQIELGHSATPREKPTEEGYTHDWTVYVKGVTGNPKYYVEKVIFLLHESFPKPRRVLKEPPYSISESGYAGFMLPIEIHFRNKEEPKKTSFIYDLWLKIGDNAKASQREKLTFQNPSEDFRKKLLKGGGIIHDKSQTSDSPSRSLPALAFRDDTTKHKSSKSLPRDVVPSEKKKSSKMASVIPSKDKSLHSQHSSTQGQTLLSSSSSHHSQINNYHEKSVNSTNLPQPSSSSSQDTFTDLFGTPIKARPDTPSSKSKDNGGSGTAKSSSSSHKTSTKKISSLDIVKSSSDSTIKSSDKEKKYKPTNGSIISSKEIKTEKDAKPLKDKSLKKRDESPKVKKEKLNKSSFDGRPTTPNLSATSSSSKKSSSLNNTSGIKKETIDSGGGGGIKDSSGNPSKKRKRSLSPPSFPPSNDSSDKKESESLIKSSSKDGLSEKSHKEKSKKQKVSSRDQVSSSATTGSNSNHKVKDVKKELSTSTTISLTNNENTGTTTLEIKSVKKEKTWDSEMKKSRSKEHKTDEVKSSRENVSKDISKVQARDKEVLKETEKEQIVPGRKEKDKNRDKSSKSRDKDREREPRDKDKEKKKNKEKDAIHDDLFSPREPVASKYSKIPKEKFLGATLSSNNHLTAHVSSLRETSSSPASIVSGSLTPGGGAFIGAPSSVSSLNGPITTLIAEMDQESPPVSPLSSSIDPTSPLTFGSKDKVTSSDDDSNPPNDHRNSNHNSSRESGGTKNTSNSSLSSNKSIHGSNQKDNTVREEPTQLTRNLHEQRGNSKREMPSSGSYKRRKVESSLHAKPMDPLDDSMDSQISPKPVNSSRSHQPSPYDYDYMNQLRSLHRELVDLRDRDILQRVVDIIEESGHYNMTNSAFDFDLLQLDRNTVRRIRQCLIST